MIKYFLIPLCLLLSGCSQKEEKPSSATMLNELRDVKKIYFAEMTVGKVAKIDDMKLSEATSLKQKVEAVLDKLKIGHRVAIYSYDTYIGAYIDLGELQPGDIKVDNESNIVRIQLPAVRTEILGRAFPLTEEHYRVTGLRSGIGAEERAQLKQKMGMQLRKEVESDTRAIEELKRNARSKAVAFLNAMTADMGYEAEVTFADDSGKEAGK